MHEFAMCEDIIKAINKNLENHNNIQKVITVNLVIGQLHNVIEDNMQFGFEVLSKGSPLEGSKLVIEFVDILARCNECKEESIITDSFFYCNNCGSGNIEIMKGRELYIKDVEVEENE